MFFFDESFEPEVEHWADATGQQAIQKLKDTKLQDPGDHKIAHYGVLKILLFGAVLIDFAIIRFEWWLLGTRDYILPPSEYIPLFVGLCVAPVLGFLVFWGGRGYWRWLGLSAMLPPIAILGFMVFERYW